MSTPAPTTLTPASQAASAASPRPPKIEPPSSSSVTRVSSYLPAITGLAIIGTGASHGRLVASGACELRLSVLAGVGLSELRLALVDLDRHPREPAEEARQPPVPITQQPHRRRQEDAPHDRGVQEDGDGQAEAELTAD